ncbi:PREDICTED: uncharacterized protein LOC108565355 [Nicrophorus vespilloides]|uniref:Uncharacterized protein LOC108565355 n=1 Tax=Nicrophorus vespilloides TaxID=110193 RepID=A0ABM1N0B7_NICVS|nr:PREDICTED: uncharacterized protein LOC108565355 [Nicrophorus vespilloides]
MVEYDCYKRTFQSVEYLAYPKCCRLGFQYEESEHRCIKSNRVMNLEGFTVFNISLSHCPLKTHAIVDYVDYDDNLRIDYGLVASLSNRNFQYGSYCLDETSNSTNLVRACQKYEDVCKTSFDDNKILCIRKCCPDGQSYKNGKKCVKTFNHGIQLKKNFFHTNEGDKFAIIQSHEGTKYPWKPEHLCEVDKIGNLKCVIRNETKAYNSLDAVYCTEARETKGVIQQMVFLYFNKDLNKPDMDFVVSSILLLISAFFLALTLITYLLTSKWMKLFEKANSCYCLITFVANVTISIVKFKPSHLWSYTSCVSLGYTNLQLFLRYLDDD